MCQHTVERSRHSTEIEGAHQQRGRLDLPTRMGTEEAPELLFSGPPAPRRLSLEGAEGLELTLTVDDSLDGGSPECANQLILEVGDADIEAQFFHLEPAEVGAEPGPFEATLEVAFLRRVTEPCQPHIQPPRTEAIEKASDVRRPAHGQDGNPLGLQIAATSRGERLDGELVADPFDQHDLASLLHTQNVATPPAAERTARVGRMT
jgi:hypothetical protein